jgi:ribonuclease VapC
VIVVDSSILVGMVRREPDVATLDELLLDEECAIGAPTLVEARLWCAVNKERGTSAWLERFADRASVAVVPFGRDMADAASRAFERFGKGSGHPAGLNFGDCMAYAVSTVLRAPLLFKGADFARTDVMAHEASIRE